MQKIPLTTKGAALLRGELERLKTIERPKITQAIAEARAHGDLKENAEYHAAKEQQGLVEARIRDVEHTLANAMIIDISTISTKDRVVFGSTITLLNTNTEVVSIYQLVGDDEADFKQSKISINTPIARAIVGKKSGDIVEVKTPSGLIEFEIMKIEFI
jgi:transcription elongation factor GreA